jgi:hypothetical protein
MAEIIAHLIASSARESRREEGPMTAEYSGTIPKRGEHVGIAQQEGVFEVVDINSLMQTANVKSTDGQGHVTRNVSWTSLKFPDKK